MPRPGKRLSPNQDNHENNATQSSLLTNFPKSSFLKLECEIKSFINHSKDRRQRRKLFSHLIPRNTMSRYNIRSNSALPRHTFRNIFLRTASSSFSSQCSSITVNYLNPNLSLESKPRESLIPLSFKNLDLEPPDFRTSQQKTSSLLIKVDNKSRTSDYLKHYKFKEEVSEGHLLALTIRKNDYDEIITHMCLCYTFDIIEKSACVEDLNWSGSSVPNCDNDAALVFAGGYGRIDGVTECRNVNLANRKYQNIDFNKDEAVEALSHMYSLHHLIDGKSSQLKDTKNIPVKVIANPQSTEDSDSMRFSLTDLPE